MIKMMRMTKMPMLMREGINKQTRYNDKMCEEKNKERVKVHEDIGFLFFQLVGHQIKRNG